MLLEEERAAAEKLGWTPASWDHGDPPVCSSAWETLEVEQRAAATALGYEKVIWDAECKADQSNVMMTLPHAVLTYALSMVPPRALVSCAAVCRDLQILLFDVILMWSYKACEVRARSVLQSVQPLRLPDIAALLQWREEGEAEQYASVISEYFGARVVHWEKLCLAGDVYTPRGQPAPFDNQLLPITAENVKGLLDAGEHLSDQQRDVAVSTYYRGVFCPTHEGLTLAEMATGPCPYCNPRARDYRHRVCSKFGLGRLLLKAHIRRGTVRW